MPYIRWSRQQWVGSTVISGCSRQEIAITASSFPVTMTGTRGSMTQRRRHFPSDRQRLRRQLGASDYCRERQPTEQQTSYPKFLGGERRCPPEDYGGIPG